MIEFRKQITGNETKRNDLRVIEIVCPPPRRDDLGLLILTQPMVEHEKGKVREPFVSLVEKRATYFSWEKDEGYNSCPVSIHPVWSDSLVSYLRWQKFLSYILDRLAGKRIRITSSKHSRRTDRRTDDRSSLGNDVSSLKRFSSSSGEMKSRVIDLENKDCLPRIFLLWGWANPVIMMLIIIIVSHLHLDRRSRERRAEWISRSMCSAKGRRDQNLAARQIVIAERNDSRANED